MKLLLGSESPRRKALLKDLGYDFQSVKIDCEEIYPDDLEPENVAAYLSELKSQNFRKLDDLEVLLTSDTVVVINGEILGKPKDLIEAAEMLKKLSGRTHQVFTAVTLRTAKNTITKTDFTDVLIDVLTESEIQFYISNFHVLDKAGSYGVQDWFGMAKVKKMTGSFYTVMGLPTHMVYEMLKDSIN